MDYFMVVDISHLGKIVVFYAMRLIISANIYSA